MRDELAHVTLSTEGDRGPEIELGAVGEEIRRHVFTNSRQASGPAEHANLVVVALADDIGTCFDQESDDVQISSFRGEMQGLRSEESRGVLRAGMRQRAPRDLSTSSQPKV
jgi:hypothetical protein